MAIKLESEGARSVAGTALTASLANVGVPTSAPARIIILFNGTDAEVVISWDGGVTEGFVLPSKGALAVDASTNKDENGAAPFLAAGAQFQAKHNGVVPTSGNVSISVIT